MVLYHKRPAGTGHLGTPPFPPVCAGRRPMSPSAVKKKGPRHPPAVELQAASEREPSAVLDGAGVDLAAVSLAAVPGVTA